MALDKSALPSNGRKQPSGSASLLCIGTIVPWGEEAFALAKKENKQVFLSIGYATCPLVPCAWPTNRLKTGKWRRC